MWVLTGWVSCLGGGGTGRSGASFPEPARDVATREPSAAPAAAARSPGERAADETSPRPDADKTVAPVVKEAIELTFVGDVIFGRWKEGGYDPIDFENVDVFGEMRELIAADLAIANLETPLIREMPAESPYGTRLRFAAPPQAAAVLRRAGFSAVTLANNHSYDMHMTGVRETPVILAEHGIRALGESRSKEPLFRVETVEVAGWKIGFVNATTWRNGPQRSHAPKLPHADMKKMTQALVPVVRRARPDHDLVIALIHWGYEYADVANRHQRRTGRALIRAGADAVICHHPHVLQAFERYRDGLIAYSLGNFLFDNTTRNQHLTGVLRLRFQRARRCLERAVLHPAYVAKQPTHHPRLATNGMRAQVHKRVIDLSRVKPFQTRWRSEGRDVVLSDPPCSRTGEATGPISP